MSNLITLREQRSKLVADARDLLNSVNEATAEGDAKEIEARFDAMMADADAIKARIDREERLAQVEADLEARVYNRAARDDISPDEARQKIDDESAAFRSYLRGGLDGLTPEHRSLILSKRAQSVGTNSAGGYTVPQGFYNRLEEALVGVGGVRPVATILRTASGNALPIPTVNETAQKGAILAENAQVSEQDATFGQITLNAYKYSSKLIRVSVELLQDSAFDLEGFLARALGERIGRATNEHFTTGDGSSKPNGIVTASTLAKTGASGQTTSVTYDDLVDLLYGLDPAYRANARWMLNDSTIKALRKLKDSNGLPLWQPSVVAGEPDTFMGKPIVVNADMPAMAAGAKSILFGDFSKYLIRDVAGIEVLRLTERYADYGQVAFMAYSRCDGDLIDAGTHPVVHYANAAS